MQLILRPYLLELKDTFTISRQSFNTKKTLIVELKEGATSGFGEASENPFYHITQEQIIDDLNRLRPLLEKVDNLSCEQFWQLMYQHLSHNLFALCALDLAYNDLRARQQGKKLYEVWDLNIDHNPKTNFTIGIDSIDKMIAKLKATQWPIYKIKLGTSHDIEIVKALRKHTSSIFRIDANCAWSLDQTLENAKQLKRLGVEFIEQPLPINAWAEAKVLLKNCELPIIADESCQSEQDVDLCINHFHGINIKLVKCGGLTPARRMIAKAKRNNLKVMVGCMTESSVAISAIAQLLPLLDYVDMDGAMLLKNDPARGVSLNNGVISYPKTPGIGVNLIS